MTKKQLFERYKIDESHGVWEPHIDNWYSIEIFRVMNNGDLPKPDGSRVEIKYIIDFLDRCHDDPKFMTSHENWGSLYLTAKRMVYMLQAEILEYINN